MTSSNTPDPKKPGVYRMRRVTLLASVAAVGGALLLAGPSGYWPSVFGTQADERGRLDTRRAGSNVPPALPTSSPR